MRVFFVVVVVHPKCSGLKAVKHQAWRILCKIIREMMVVQSVDS